MSVDQVRSVEKKFPGRSVLKRQGYYLRISFGYLPSGAQFFYARHAKPPGDLSALKNVAFLFIKKIR
jgi:hypothetical protein